MTVTAVERSAGGSMRAAILDLNEVELESEFGGKAASLGRALRAGLPVPAGFSLCTSAVDALVARDPATQQLLMEYLVRTGMPVAVRSSAVGEDSAAASCAGQHCTVLGVVGADAAVEAIHKVRASGAADAALGYRRRMGVAEEARVAVVVQRMARASRAGVLFTRNPVSGAEEYVVEAVRGLGEMLVSGRATPARYRLSRQAALTEFQPGYQAVALALGEDGRVTEQAVEPPELTSEVLSADELCALVELSRRCEKIFGGAQDLEWAFEDGALFLLQARPITTLGADARTADAGLGKLVRSRNVLHGDAGRGVLWSRVNVGEAIPGTIRALTAEFHRDSIELSPQWMFQRMGVMPAGPARRPQNASESPSQFLCGKMSINVDYMRAVADRIPGTSGAALEEAMFGRVRPGIAGRPDRSRYPIIAAKLLWIIATLPRKLERLQVETHGWWQTATGELAAADLPRAVAAFEDACARYARIIVEQALIATLSAGFWDPVARRVRRIGTEDDLLQMTAGYGNVQETRMLERLWDVSRGRLSLDVFIAEYGYFAASAGELAHPSWREERSTLEQIVARYRALPESGRPAARCRTVRESYERTRERILAAASTGQGLALRASLRLAARMLPIREVGKACMVMGTDVGRAAARRVGLLLAQRGDIGHPDDVFHLTRAQLREATMRGTDLRAAAESMRRLHEFYQATELPDFFTSEELAALIEKRLAPGERDGNVTPVRAPRADATRRIQAVGVSRGHHTGTARVIQDPSRVARFDPGDVLVCNITDPGWSALFSIAGAMVVDIGGMLSHSAIIARELGIPAVVNTRDGSRRIPDGARVAVNGGTGEVIIVSVPSTGSVSA